MHGARQLLKLFQTQIVFEQSKMNGDQYHHVKDLNDLGNNLALPVANRIFFAA